MSLWEKWESEKLEKQGIKVERHSDVEIREMHSEPNLYKQTWIVVGALAACFFAVYAALVLEAVINGRRWSDTYLIRLFAQKEAQREAISGNR